MKDVEVQKTKLLQKKNRIALDEAKLALKERKMRTRLLITLGGLVAETGLDELPTNALCGALLSLKQTIEKEGGIPDRWVKLGDEALAEKTKEKIPVIVKLKEKPPPETCSLIRKQGLKRNALRDEWYGYVNDIASLESELGGLEYSLEKIELHKA